MDVLVTGKVNQLISIDGGQETVEVEFSASGVWNQPNDLALNNSPSYVYVSSKSGQKAMGTIDRIPRQTILRLVDAGQHGYDVMVLRVVGPLKYQVG